MQASGPIDAYVAHPMVEPHGPPHRTPTVHLTIREDSVENRAVGHEGVAHHLLGEPALILWAHILEKGDVLWRVEGMHGPLTQHLWANYLHLFVQAIPNDQAMGHADAVRLHGVPFPIVDVANL